jgi:L-aspartate oxidase
MFPMSDIPSFLTTDVLVIGAGVAGLLCALEAAEKGLNVAIAFKTSHAKNCNTAYAQGGIAAALSWNTPDSLAQHVQDTLNAGATLCDPGAVEGILSRGEVAIQRLITYGVQFDTGVNGKLALSREAAHTHPRILHVDGDQTGIGILKVLIDHVKSHPNITALPHHQLVDLHTGKVADIPKEDPSTTVGTTSVTGATLWNHQNARIVTLHAPNVVLATGGYAGVFPNSTNPSSSRGDVLYLASQTGAQVENLHLVQFHPTGFMHEGHIRFLVSEALRGEGGRLVNCHGEAFATRYHPDGELAPRDVVARANDAEMQRTQHPCVYLDMTHLEKVYLQHRFPAIYGMALDYGVDMANTPLPVAPAAHYCMGGIKTSPMGATAVAGLFAIGEAASTGLHGANRLASNSLLECAAMGLGVVEHLLPTRGLPTSLPRLLITRADAIMQASLEDVQHQLVSIMHHALGLRRTEGGLRAATHRLATLSTEINPFSNILEKRDVAATYFLVEQAVHHALAMPYSCGAHYMEAHTTHHAPSVNVSNW